MDFLLPELGEGVYEAEMVRWLATIGDQVKPGQPLLEVLTDKATMEVPSPFHGFISGLDVEPGQKLKIGQKLLSYDGDGAPPRTGKEPVRSNESRPLPEATARAKEKSDPAIDIVKASPAVRQRAHQLGVDLSQVQGSGPERRVLVSDLAAVVGSPTPSTSHSAVEAAPKSLQPGDRIKFQGVRRKIAEHMVAAKHTIPHYTYVDECDVTDLVRTRVGLRDLYAQKGVKLTYPAFFIKAVALALRDVPLVNASLDEAAGEIVLHDRYHIGIAVATPTGLIVPVVKDADRLSLLEIAREIQRLGDEARAGQSKLDDLKGGTFSLTSIGSIGGLFATPIINYPQVGILGIGRFVQRPVFDPRGQVVAADMVYLSFSFDHRVLDGAVGAAFGNAVVKRLQKPLELAMG